MKQPPWFDPTNTGQLQDGISAVQTCYLKDLVAYAAKTGNSVKDFNLGGLTSDSDALAKIDKFLSDFEFVLWGEQDNRWKVLPKEEAPEPGVLGYTHTRWYLGPWGTLYVGVTKQSGDPSLNILLSGYCLGGQVHAKAKEVMESMDLQSVPQDAGAPYVAVLKGGNLRFMRAKPLGEPFTPENYPSETREAFAYILEHLASDDPPGKLVVMDGPPGTGKTHLIQALIQSLNNTCRCVLVPPRMVEDIADPGYLESWMNFTEEDNRKIVLILEDADQALLVREGLGASSISSMLNMADGIYGRVLDIRIVATTNGKHMEIDPALLRDGRLLTRIDMRHLSMKEAQETFMKLCPDSDKKLVDLLPKEAPRGHVSLATVYATAYKEGWRKAPGKKGGVRAPTYAVKAGATRIGFRQTPPDRLGILSYRALNTGPYAPCPPSRRAQPLPAIL